MPRPRPPHLRHETTRHDKRVWYVRIHSQRIRLRADYGLDVAFIGYTSAAGKHFQTGYRVGRTQPLFAAKTPAIIAAGRDRRGKTPFQARHFLDAMRGLFAWAQEAQFVKSNPAAEVKYPLLKSGEGFPIWTEEDVATFEARWPLGTKERVWLSVLLYTGLRRGDAVRLGCQHVRDGIATIRTQKTGTEVHLPILPELQEAIDHGPTSDLAFICGSTGKPMTKESFGNAFADACRAAGVNKSAHGLRKIGATRAANNGATVAALNSIFGWSGSKMASLYTANADRARLSREHMDKMRTKYAAPMGKVRRGTSKGK